MKGCIPWGELMLEQERVFLVFVLISLYPTLLQLIANNLNYSSQVESVLPMIAVSDLPVIISTTKIFTVFSPPVLVRKGSDIMG